MRKTMRLSRTIVHEWPAWIDVRDELPEPVVDVLTVDDEGERRIAWYSSLKESWHAVYPMRPIAVTHWMPLPEAPDGGE